MKRRPRALPAVELQSEITNVSVPNVIGAFDDGLLPLAVANGDVTVEVAWWSGLERLTRLQLEWARRDSESYIDIGNSYLVSSAEADNPNTVFSLVIPQGELLTEGRYDLRLRSNTIGNNISHSNPTPLEVDRTPPGGIDPPKLHFPPDVVTSGITPERLVNGKAIATLPDWFDLKAGDVVTPMIGGVKLSPMSPVGGIGPNFEVDFLRADLLAAGDGPHEFTYTLTDRAGNESLPAPFVTIHIRLQEAPDNLLAPLVPAAENGLITFDDTFPAPLEVHIPPYTNVKVGDEIKLYWGSSLVGTLNVTDALANPVLTFTIGYSVLVNVVIRGDVDVTYTVARGAALYGPSPETTVAVDLTLPGGPDIDPISGVHRNLKPALTTSASGAVNEIPAVDFNSNATITVAWHGMDGTTEVYLENDEIVINWGGQAGVITHTVTAANVVDKDDLEFTLPAAVIAATGTGQIPVRYTITRQLGAGHSNTAVAPTEIVLVQSMQDLPGGDDGLDEGTFPEALPFPDPYFAVINRELIETDKAYYRIASYTNITANDTIIVSFRGTDEWEGTGAPIPGTNGTLSHTVVTADITRGHIDFQISRMTWMRICSGAIHVTYEVTNGFGSANSPEHHVVVDGKLPGETACPLP